MRLRLRLGLRVRLRPSLRLRLLTCSAPRLPRSPISHISFQLSQVFRLHCRRFLIDHRT